MLLLLSLRPLPMLQLLLQLLLFLLPLLLLLPLLCDGVQEAIVQRQRW